MIYIGGKRVLTSIFVGSSSASSVYIGSRKAYPTNVRYVISNTRAQYSSGGYIFASGANYATVLCDWEKYVDDVLAESGTSTCSVAGSASGFYISADTYVCAYSRGTTVGSQRSITVTPSYMGASGNSVTIYQQANSRTYQEITTSLIWDAWTNVPYSGVTGGGNIYGTRAYNYQYVYTSTATGDTGSTSDSVTAQLITSSYAWLTVQNNNVLYVSINRGAARSGSVKAYYTAVSEFGSITSGWCSVSQEAYVAPTYSYRITYFAIQPTYMAGGTFGPNNLAEMTVNVQYKVNDGAWTDYKGSGGEYVPIISIPTSQSHFVLTDSNGTALGYQEVEVIYNGTKNGKLYLKAVEAVSGEDDIIVSPLLEYASESSSVTFTHQGVQVEPTITVSPTAITASTYGQSGNITVNSNKTGWTATSSYSWITVTKTSNTNVRYTVEQNTTEDDRGGYIIFQNGTASTTCQITQKAGYVFSLTSPNPFYFGATSSSFRIDIVSKQGDTWVPVTVSHTIGWINGYTITSGVSGAYITFTCSQNTLYQDRSGTIRITQSGSSNYIDLTVTQKAKGFTPYISFNISGFEPSSIRASRYGTASGNVGVLSASCRFSWDNTTWYDYDGTQSGFGTPYITIASQTTADHFHLCSGVGGYDRGTTNNLGYNSTEKLWYGYIYATSRNDDSKQTANCNIYWDNNLRNATFEHSKD